MLHKRLKLLAIASAALAAVAADICVTSLTLKELAKEFPEYTVLFSSAPLIGMLLGSFFGGILADRFGRKPVVLCAAILHSVSTIALAYAWCGAVAVLLRIVTGVGAGAFLPVAASLVAEYSDPETRGRMVCVLDSFWSVGWLLAVVTAWALLDSFGWRTYSLIVGAIALALSAPLIVMPESIRFLVASGKYEDARRLAYEFGIPIPKVKQVRLGIREQLRLLLVTYRRATLSLWIVWFCMTMGYYGIFLWLPKLMTELSAEIGEFITSNYYQYLTLMTLAQLPGFYSAVVLVDRVGRKPVLATYIAAVAVASYMYANAATVTEFVAWGIALSFFDLGAWAALYVHTPEQYPTQIRAIGAAWASAFGRIGGIIGPTLTGIVKDWNTVFTIFAAVHLVAATAALLGKEQKGREMPELT